MNKISLVVIVMLLSLSVIIHNKPAKSPEITEPEPINITPEPKPEPEPKPPKKNTIQKQLIMAHNSTRKSHGKGELKEDAKLNEIAQKWAEHMAKTGVMRHQALNFGGGFMGMGENIAMGQRNVEEVMRAWMSSPGHRRNILGNYTHIGVGVAEGARGRFWCVDFGKGRSVIFNIKLFTK